jgi:hypothetical protein
MATPPCSWAQNVDTIFLRVLLPHLHGPHVEFAADEIVISAADGLAEPVAFKLNGAIDPERSVFGLDHQGLDIRMPKAEPGTPYWPRLLSAKGKPHWLSVDWPRYEAEPDSEEEAPEMPAMGGGDFGGMDFSGMDFGGEGGLDMSALQGMM